MTAALACDIAADAISAGLAAVLTARLWWVWRHRSDYQPNRPRRTR